MAVSSHGAIERFFGALADLLVRHCRVLMVVALVSVILPAWWLRHIETYNPIETWLLRESPEYRQYQDFLKTFGSEEYVVLAATTEDPFSAESLERQRRLAARLEDLDGVDGVLNLPGLAAAVWPDRPDWRDEARETPFLRNLLVGEDLKTIGVLAWIRQGQAPPDQVRTVDDIVSIGREESGPGFQLHTAGTLLVNVALNRACMRDLSLFVPLAVGAAVCVLIIVFRTPAPVLAAMGAVTVTVIWTLGLMARTGFALNMVTVVLPPVLVMLVLSTGIHLGSRFRDKLATVASRRAAMQETVRELIRPATLASVTTVVGFGSLVVSEMQPVFEVGMFAAIGISIGLVMNLIMVPGILLVLPCRPNSAFRVHKHWTSRTGAAMTRFWWIVVPVATVVVAACAVSISQITINPSVLRFLPSKSDVKKDYVWINDRLTGFYTMEIVARTKPEGEDAVLDAMDRLNESLCRRPDVVRTIHIGQIVPFIDRATMVGGTGGRTGHYVSSIRDRFRRVEGGQIVLRQSVIVREGQVPALDDLVDTVAAEARREIPETASVAITGIVSLMKQAERGLLRSQIRSFALAGGICLLTIGLLYASLRAFVVSVLPNLLPVGGTFALMAIIGIPLDCATVMIASVSISIAVDDTIHYLECYRTARRDGMDAAASAAETYARAGRAMIFTSVIASVGFMTLSLSSFVPMADVGILLAIAMMTALAGDLFVTPAMARLVNLWAKP